MVIAWIAAKVYHFSCAEIPGIAGELTRHVDAIIWYPGSADNDHDLLTNAYRALESAKSEGTDSIKLWEDNS